MSTSTKSDKIWLWAALLYAIVVILLGAYANYSHPYSPEPVTTANFWTLFLWVLLYVPVIVLTLTTTANTAIPWRVTEFGFTLSVRMALIAALCALVLGLATSSITITWTSAILEAFARTGEEVFFRGFLLALFTRLFAEKRHPRRWAILLSALLFALVHTQTFRPEFRDWYSSSPQMPLAYRIIERLFDLFLSALLLGLLCVWTRSVLPIAILHSALKSSILTLPFVLLIYGLITFWAHKRGEQVVLKL
ncbi:MAG: CPBP family glutamic-type intramembrane protease [Anaerolineae bacterium]